jgi:hypothetical protein
MFKNISFSQYKEKYLSHNKENDIINLKDNTKPGWGFYINIETTPQLINRSLTENLDIDINEINDSMIDYNTDTDTDTDTSKYKYLLQIIPICVIVFCII